MGGSMYIHTFGCYFGIAATYFFQNEKAILDKEKRAVGGYMSQTVAMIGTIFLYCYWPSFNAALAPQLNQQRVVVNTALSISAACITAAGISRIIHFKLDMEVMLNSTLAGGVAIGACSDLVVTPGIAIIIGSGAGIISALGFSYLNKGLQKWTKLHDTCGV